MNIRDWLRELIGSKPRSDASDSPGPGPEAPSSAVEEPDRPAAEADARKETGGGRDSTGRTGLFGRVVPGAGAGAARREGVARARRRVIVGCDFGTSGTKVVFRNIVGNDTAPRMVDFGTTTAGYSRFCFPSTLAIRDGELLAGCDAEAAAVTPGAEVLRSVKMLLLRQNGDGNGTSSARLDRLEANERAEFAVAAQVSAVLRFVRALLRSEYPGIGDEELSFNFDIPVDQMGRSNGSEAAAVERFDRAFRSAVAWSDRTAPDGLGGAIEDWRHITAEQRANPVPVGEDRIRLVAEGMAIIQGIRDVTVLEEGRNYSVVDVGAGTTDIGIFRFVRWSDHDRIPFLASDTHRIGCDDLDHRIATQLLGGERNGAALSASVRVAKVSLSAGGVRAVRLDGWDGELTRKDVEDAVASLKENLAGLFRSTLRKAYRVHPCENTWQRLEMAVVGGGSMIDPLRKCFESAHNPGSVFRVHPIPLERLGAPEGGKVVGQSAETPDATDLRFLIPALGLSHAVERMPRFMHPEQIEPHATPRGATGLYDGYVPPD